MKARAYDSSVLLHRGRMFLVATITWTRWSRLTTPVVPTAVSENHLGLLLGSPLEVDPIAS
jgi:hypothetical protein